MPVRIYEISKKLGLENAKILAYAKASGINAAKVPSSSLDSITAEYLEEEILKAHPEIKAKLAPPKPRFVNMTLEQSAIAHQIATAAELVFPTGGVQHARRLVIPLRNREQNFFDVSPWFLADNIRVEPISDEDYATLHREETEIFCPIVTAKSQCLSVTLKGDEAEQTAYEAAAKIQFVFKTFSKRPLILSHAAVVAVAKGQKAYVEKSLALPVWGDYGQFLSSPFVFTEGVSAEKITQFYDILTKAMEKHPGLLITLSRFNSCWLRSTDHDRVIDVAVSLESLLSSVTEIKFRFALFNSFITHSSPPEREKAFEILKLLYDVRSSIVHGDTKSTQNKKKIDLLLQSMDEVFRIAQAAITYYIFFLYSRDPSDWQTHLEKLVFGTEIRLNQEENKIEQ